MFKKFLVVLNIFCVCLSSIAYAADKSYSIIAIVLNTFLNILSWFGYAISLGILIWMGIKYVLSTANEKANLKGLFSKYIIGVALITMCSTIAGFVANIAAGDKEENTASGVVDKGFQLGDITVAEKKDEYSDFVQSPEYFEAKLEIESQAAAIKNLKQNNAHWNIDQVKKGHLNVYMPKNVVHIVKDVAGKAPVITAHERNNDGKKFYGWYIETTDAKGIVTTQLINDREFEAVGSDPVLFGLGATKSYKMYAIYEGDLDIEDKLTPDWYNGKLPLIGDSN